MVAGKCNLARRLSVSSMINTMNDTINELTVTKSLRLLRDGFKSDFATFAYADERMTVLLQELASEFVETNIPVVDEDNQTELKFMLMETLDIIAR
jgi:hypothetical protein